MINLNCDKIKDLLQVPQDSIRPFKLIDLEDEHSRKTHRSVLADEIASFANSDGGLLLFGVTDKREIQGMPQDQGAALERSLVDLASSSITPPIRIDTQFVEISRGQLVLAVKIPTGYSCHLSPGGCFHRVGSSKRRMTRDEELGLAQRRSQSRFVWYDKQPVSQTGLGSLTRSLWQPLLSVEGQRDPELALEKMGLLSPRTGGSRKATVAGLLLCSREPETIFPSACITATRYRGLDQASAQVDAQTIGGPLHSQVADAVAFVLRNMRVGARKVPEREDLPQYSERAVFEAVVNAVAHRDYSIQGSRIRISMFDDRLEIRSPGGLPNTLTVESMAERQSTRNEVVASVFGRMPVGRIKGTGARRYLMERRGDGVPIINRETRSISGSEPKYRLLDGSELCLTIPAAVIDTTGIQATVRVASEGRRLGSAHILALFPNNTWRSTRTDWRGKAILDLHADHLPMTIFAAKRACQAVVIEGWIPRSGDLSIDLEPLEDGGSAIFQEGYGELPGLLGSLNPVRDTPDRTYLYSSNIAINYGAHQPVSFRFGENIILTDSVGNELLIKIENIVGISSILEYRRVPSDYKWTFDMD